MIDWISGTYCDHSLNYLSSVFQKSALGLAAMHLSFSGRTMERLPAAKRASLALESRAHPLTPASLNPLPSINASMLIVSPVDTVFQ